MSVEQDAHKGKNRAKGVNRALNKVTGKESVKILSFSKVNWGETTLKYMKSVKALQEWSWKKIVQQAQPFVTTKSSMPLTTCEGNEDEVEDKRALLINISDLESDADQ